MRDDDNILWTLVLLFAPLSLLSVGGAASILAPIHNQTVNVRGWLTPLEFVEYFAISRAAPGPGAMLVTLIGFKVAGWWGALVATLAILLPSSVLLYGMARVWNRYRGTAFHNALERGLAPVGTGLILAGSLAIMRAADAGWVGWTLAAVSTAVLVWRSIHPLLILAAGGAIYVGVNIALAPGVGN
ncbi:MAG: chromate transporter [Alphaproteobacteria bacterium]